MKIRQGFVSNSSSSSFCIFGTEITDLVHSKKFKEFVKTLSEENEDFDKYYDEIFFERIDILLSKTGFYFTCMYEDCYYIGREYSTIENKETGEEFKESTKRELKKLFNGLIDNCKFKHIEECSGG